MAEALTAIEVALAISSVVKGLYSYATSVKDAKQDIRRLTQELFALKSALEYFDLHSRNDIPGNIRQQASEILSFANETLKGVSTRLQRAQSGRLRGAVVAATWPFKSGEMQKHIDSIERAKTWFVMVILQDGTETTRQVYDDLKGLVQLVQEDILERKTSEMTKETEILFEWLSPFNSSAQISKAIKERAPGTGKWAVREQFREWIEPYWTKRPFLWISGKSGSGKTVLFSTFVEQLQAICSEHKPEKRLIGYHCCSLDEAASQQIVNIFGSILAHIGSSRPGLLEKVAQHRRESSSLVPQNNLTLEQIHETFDTIAESAECVYVLVDALNEAPYTRALLVENLLGLCRRHANVRVLVTCTGEPPQTHKMIQAQSMSSTQVNFDIELYVRHRLQTDVGFANTSLDIKQQIMANIVSNAQGMFRWAKLCMDRLSVLRTGRDIRDTLADMPRTLNDTYVGILDRVAAHDAPLAREALLWLCFSVRPLKLSELAEAVILRVGDTVVDDDSRLMNQMVILDVCQGLAVRNDQGLITLAHDSVRSFLTSEHIKASRVAFFSLDHDASQAHIMRRCLLYLNLRPFLLGPVSTQEEFVRRKQAHPLLKYATFSWALHSALFPLRQEDENDIFAFFGTKTSYNGGSFDSWVQSLLYSLDLETIRQTQPLYYAASFNMIPILRLLLRPEFGVDVEQKGGRFGSPPLFIALWRHNWEAAEILLKAGADPLALDYETTCYELVSHRGEDESRIKMLMDLILATRDTRPGSGNGEKLRAASRPPIDTLGETTQAVNAEAGNGDIKMGEPSGLPLRLR